MMSISPRLLLCAVLAASVAPGALLAQTSGDQQQDAAPPTQQGAPPPPDHRPANPRHEAKHLTKVLGLSADQRSRIEPILANRDQQVQGIQANSALSPQQRRAQLRAARQDADNQIQAVLTDQQNQQWQQMKEQHHAQKAAASEPPPPPTNS